MHFNIINYTSKKLKTITVQKSQKFNLGCKINKNNELLEAVYKRNSYTQVVKWMPSIEDASSLDIVVECYSIKSNAIVEQKRDNYTYFKCVIRYKNWFYRNQKLYHI